MDRRDFMVGTAAVVASTAVPVNLATPQGQDVFYNLALKTGLNNGTSAANAFRGATFRVAPNPSGSIHITNAAVSHDRDNPYQLILEPINTPDRKG